MSTDISLRYLLLGEDKSATSTIGKVGGAFNKLGSQVGGEFGDILNKVGDGIDKIGEHAHSMGAKLTGAGAIVAGVGVAFQMAGSREAQGAAQLDAAITATGQSAQDYKGQIEEAIKANEKYGFGAADTQQALMKLTAATNDPKKALAQMTTVANLAASQHESLAQAASQVARVYGGSGKVLKQYGIIMGSTKVAASQLRTAEKTHESALTGLSKAQQRLTQLEQIDHAKKKLTIGDQISLKNAHQAVRQAQEKVHASTVALSAAQAKNAKASHAVQDAVNELGHRLSGQAAASVDNFSGKIRVLQTRIGDWTAQMGQKLGPALTIAGPALMGLGTIIELGIVPKIASAVAGGAVWIAQTIASTAATIAHGVAMAAVAVATGVWTAAQWALNVAMSANPLTIIIIAIVAFIAIIVLAYTHVTWFRNAVNAAFHAITSVISGTFNWVKGHWPLLLAILTGPVGLAVLGITKRWGTITSFFKGVPKALGAAVASVTSFLTAPFIDAFNRIADAWNATVGRLHWSIPGWVPGLGGKSISAPTLPHFAAGVSGVINRPGMFMAGEGGNPEAISITPLGAGRHGGSGGGGDIYQITIQALSPEEAGAAVERVLVKRKVRQGRLAFQ